MKGGLNFFRGTGSSAMAYFHEGHEALEVESAHPAHYYVDNPNALTAIETYFAGDASGPDVAIDAAQFEKWVDGYDPFSGEKRGRVNARKDAERQSLKFVEFGINNAKSLSLLESQDPAFHALMERVRDQQRAACLSYISQVAVTRVGPFGEQVEVGNLRVEATHVRHATSRDGDPHYHQHVLVNAKAFDAQSDAWRTVHSASLRQHIAAINAVGDLAVSSSPELHEALSQRGLHFDFASGEIVELAHLTKRFSKRRTAIMAARERLEGEWRVANPGRAMGTHTRAVLNAEAWNENRKAKAGERETPEAFAERIRAELDTYGVGSLTSRAVVMTLPELVATDELVARTLARVENARSTWHAGDLTAAAGVELREAGFVGGEAERTARLADLVTAVTSQCHSRLAPGLVARSTTRDLTSARLEGEQQSIERLLALLGVHQPLDEPGMVQGRSEGLSEGQIEAVGLVASHARLGVVVGPAGTGKTTMLRVAAQRLRNQRRAVVLTSPTNQGARVAAAEIGVDGSSLDRLLHHNGFRWDDLGRWTRIDVEVDDAWRLTARSVVIVDEASMVTRPQFLALLDLANESGASVRLVGDPDQLGAVGRGGVMAEASHFTNPVILDTVHRFQRVAVHENLDGSTWSEQVTDASYARLMGLVRAGIAPEDTARRLVTGGHVQRHVDEDSLLQAVAAEVVASWGTPRAAAVTVPTNDTARRLSEQIRSGLVAQGVVNDERVVFGREGERIGVGDHVVSRANDRELGVMNRQVFTVEAVSTDGTLRVRSTGATKGAALHLPPAFVAANFELAYAVTGHGNQGVTAPTAHGVHGDTMDRAGLYVALSRGRLANTLHVIAEDDQDAQQQIAHTLATRYGDEGLAAATLIANADARATRPEPEFAVDDLRLLLHASGLSPDTVEAAMSSPALNVLRGALDDLSAAGVDVDATVPALVTMRELGSAEDVTSVLHYRVTTLLSDLGPVDVAAPATTDQDAAPVVAATRASVQRQLREEQTRARLRRATGAEPTAEEVTTALDEARARTQAELNATVHAEPPTKTQGPELGR